MLNRCKWVGNDPIYIEYHDKEWGVPVHDDKKLFEFIILEGAQAGLSWSTILKRRENYRKAFADFDAGKSDALSKDLKKRGFKFVGSTIIYAHMQAVGMVNDHTTDCFRYKELLGQRHLNTMIYPRRGVKHYDESP